MQPSEQVTCFVEHWNENGVSSFHFSESRITDKQLILSFQELIPEKNKQESLVVEKTVATMK